MELKNEQLGQSATDDEFTVDEVIDENEVAVTFDIASYPSDLTLSVLNEMYREGDIVIPEFQRNFIWSIRQSSLLIESFLLGLPVPQVFFYVDDANRSLVIDGQQRILSVVYYLEGYFGSEDTQSRRQVFKLMGLSEASPYSLKRFVDLDDSAQRKLRGSVLRAINIRQLNPKGAPTSIYHIFERLNTGGTPLKPQEIRNCVFRGGLVGVLRTLNLDVNWRKILGRAVLDRHQKDIELILRLLALSGSVATYERPLKEFLNKAMEREKSGTSPRLLQFAAGFPKTAATIVELLGERPFHLRGPVNSSALDAVFCTILDNLDRLPADLATRYEALRQDKEFLDNTFAGTSDTIAVRTRFSRARKLLLG